MSCERAGKDDTVNRTQAADGQPEAETSNHETEPSNIKVAGDVGLTFDYWKRGLGKIKGAIEWVFHYFFVGCVSLLGLAIVILIPLSLGACVAVILGLPGYVLYQCFGTEGPDGESVSRLGEYFSPLNVVVTIFWAGYFFTHGWPRVQSKLQSIFQKLGPVFDWGRTMLTRFSEKEE